jgi:hypothetical protein
MTIFLRSNFAVVFQRACLGRKLLGHFILIRDQPVLSYVHLFVLQCLRISNSVKQQYTTGEIVSLVSVECQRIQEQYSLCLAAGYIPLGTCGFHNQLN